MTKFLLIVIAVLFVALIVLFFLWRLNAAKRKSQKETIDRLVNQLNEAIVQQSKLESTIDILKKNRDKADEKIDDLHDGDSVNNAIDELRKHKN